MAGTHEVLNALMQRLEGMDRQLTCLREEVLCYMPYLKQLQPHAYLRAVRKPTQGSDYKRVINVAEFMRSEINDINEEIVPGQRRLFQFPANLSNEQINADASRCISLMLARELDRDYGRITYEKLFYENPAIFAKIVGEASICPELAVFSQSAGKWAIEVIIRNTMMSQIAKVKRREESARKKSREAIDLINEQLAQNGDEPVRNTNSASHGELPFADQSDGTVATNAPIDARNGGSSGQSNRASCHSRGAVAIRGRPPSAAAIRRGLNANNCSSAGMMTRGRGSKRARNARTHSSNASQ